MSTELEDVTRSNHSKSRFCSLHVTIHSAVLNRMQKTLELQRKVVLESSAEYWYEQGKEANKIEVWDKATFDLRQCITIDATHWQGILQLTSAQAYIGNTEGTVMGLLLWTFEEYFTDWLLFNSELSTAQWDKIKFELESHKSPNKDPFKVQLALALIQWLRFGTVSSRQVLQEMAMIYSSQVRLSATWHRLAGTLWHYEKEYNNAILEYSKAIALAPQKPFAYYERGLTKRNLDDQTGALADFNMAIELGPENATVYLQRGMTKSKLNDTAGAVADYTQSIIINPKSGVLAHLLCGNAKMELQDYGGALAAYNVLIELFPDYRTAYFNRGVLKRQMQDYSGAITDFDQAIALEPLEAKAYYSRGLAKRSLQNHEGALADYDHAISLDTQYVDAYITRANARREKKDFMGALADYEQAAQFAPTSASTYVCRGEIKQLLGDARGAELDWRIADRLFD